LLIIFLTVFIDLIGFGIVLPLLPVFSKDFGASGFMIGLIMASYSVMQFLFAPWWGRLSDRIGRRPVLLISTAGAALSYTLFAIACQFPNGTGLWLLLVSRIFAGICGANITVAQAYIADITPPEKRSAKMGLVGMAFGLGFIFGPAIGAITYKHFGITGPGFVAAGFCAANLMLAWFVLRESLQPGSEHAASRTRFAQWSHAMAHPKIGLLITVFFLATFAFTCFETTIGLLVTRNFHLDLSGSDSAKATVGYLFAYCGIIGALVQGGAIGKLVKKMGEPKLISVSLFLAAISLVLLPFVQGSWLNLLLVLALLSIGSSLTRPPVFGLISILTPAHEQGATIGVAQSAGSLARIAGPIFAATVFTLCDVRRDLSHCWRNRVATPDHAHIFSGSNAIAWHQSRYANGEISDGLISLRPPQKTFV
jgi:MFS transporter, DHA1 family, tetracycline resistance protein